MHFRKRGMGVAGAGEEDAEEIDSPSRYLYGEFHLERHGGNRSGYWCWSTRNLRGRQSASLTRQTGSNPTKTSFLAFLEKLGLGNDLETALGPCMSGFQDETGYGEESFGLTCLIDAVVAMSGSDPATSPSTQGNHDTWRLAFSWLLYAENTALENLLLFSEFPSEPEFTPLLLQQQQQQKVPFPDRMAYYRGLASRFIAWQCECHAIIDRLVEDLVCIEWTFREILQASRMGPLGWRMARVVELIRCLRSGDFKAQINSRVARVKRRCKNGSMPERRR